MTQFEILWSDDSARWHAVLDRVVQHDWYFLPEYHTLVERQEQGKACLVVYSEGDYLIALPLLLRSIHKIQGLESIENKYYDASSVYGYVGPITSHREVPPSVIGNFQTALRSGLQDMGVVALFSRLHPLIAQEFLIASAGECIPIGQTISIDLTLSFAAQWMQYRANHKHGINRLRRMGATCSEDHVSNHLDAFIDIYYETMRRVKAVSNYYFTRDYFHELISNPELNLHLFTVMLNGTMICGGLFAMCDGIIQYHLGGTCSEFLKMAPMKLVFDTVRVWGVEHGAWAFHLGGGVGSQADSLFQFKRGFSNRRHVFKVWRWIIVPDVYHQFCEQRLVWIERKKRLLIEPGYFPLYRAPIK